MIAPEQEKGMAKQINATTRVLPSSHVAMLSHPKVAKVIEKAYAGTEVSQQNVSFMRPANDIRLRDKAFFNRIERPFQ